VVVVMDVVAVDVSVLVTVVVGVVTVGDVVCVMDSTVDVVIDVVAVDVSVVVRVVLGVVATLNDGVDLLSSFLVISGVEVLPV